ncbi:AmmeMemoRadiSam system protein B [Breznakiella homolactica]|uniref:AmmeMemoRadiSam system protein B n=1 Tax=Breznakiella homolactica TaxID=2798577 RepID=A0A7T7XKE0_9SPIR|nr:AmmeMemoRadiSam system protein B [Breznakiella homolactica]QQO07966.1 AmmeMemoRadiSam system protein B [Breznakiella homolactica]
MNLRKRGLLGGWYPDSAEKISLFLGSLADGCQRGSAFACLAPHAGWYYSGSLGARALLSLDPQTDTVIVIGGHLPGGYPVLAAEEDGFETPLGPLEADGELRDSLFKVFSAAPDNQTDNTVEIHLPMVRFFFPEARVVWMRLPADTASFEAGKRIAEISDTLGRRTAVVASTDLTHYGPNYRFTPRGTGPEALTWVKEKNDTDFIDAVSAGDPEAVLERAGRDHSACSAGAVLGAMGFARGRGAEHAVLLGYHTSADIDPHPSFVGYAAMAWYPA